MPAYWEQREPATSETLTSVVATGERVIGLLAEEAALRRNKSQTAAAKRGPRAGAKDEAATAVETAAKGQGNRRRRPSRGASRGSARGSRPGPGRGQHREQQGPGAEL
jgi:hypothetical protein